MLLFEGKKVIVTSGATQEPLDGVRFLTNISRGSFGAMIADEAVIQGAEVFYVHGKNAVIPHFAHSMRLVRVQTVADLLRELEHLIHVEDADVVIHAMAVSDFQVDMILNYQGRELRGEKINAGQSLTVHLKPTPNIIPRIKAWKNDIFLVGFELEPVEAESELIEIGRRSLRKNNMDLCVVRRLHRIRAEDHEALFVNMKGSVEKHKGRSLIAKKLVRAIYYQMHPEAAPEAAAARG